MEYHIPKNSLPRKWMNYIPFGDVIQNTNILAFKVPLQETKVECLPPEHRFTVNILVKNFPRLRAVIDLTDTYKYYNPQEMTDAGIVYKKLRIRGQEIPPETSVTQFFHLLDELIAGCADGEIVGVHCTHGVNRTGYLICRYLMNRFNWNVYDALGAFSQARGHSIDRQTYVDALKRFTNDRFMHSNQR